MGTTDASNFHLGTLIGSFFISVFIIGIIFYFGKRLIRPSGTAAKIVFKDIVRDENWYPSLARFQFLIWTWIVLFVIISIFCYKNFNGIHDISGETYNIPYNLLALMGMTMAVPVASGYISAVKYSKMISSGRRPEDAKMPSFGTMLAENDKPELARFQMFAWTWVSVIFYIVSFIFQISQNFQDPNQMKIPDVPTVFVILMGISQGAYIGTKLTLTQVFTITSINPNNIDSTQPYAGMIQGSNFGTDKVSVDLFDENDEFKKHLTELSPINDNLLKISIAANTFAKVDFPAETSAPNKSYCYFKIGKNGQFSDKNNEARLEITA